MCRRPHICNNYGAAFFMGLIVCVADRLGAASCTTPIWATRGSNGLLISQNFYLFFDRFRFLHISVLKIRAHNNNIWIHIPPPPHPPATERDTLVSWCTRAAPPHLHRHAAPQVPSRVTLLAGEELWAKNSSTFWLQYFSISCLKFQHLSL